MYSLLALSFRYKVSFLFIFVVTLLNAQHPFDESLNPLKDVLPPSPTASALATYGEIPVSLHTGIPNVSVPLCNVSGRSLSVPVSLSYHGGGQRVDEISSWVGMGWSLNAGGVITRTVQGIEDDRTGSGYFARTIPNDFLVNPPANPVTQQEALEAEAFHTYLNNVSNGVWDAQPDQFNFNINGYSGRFYIENDGGVLTPRLVPHQNIKIEPYFNVATGELTQFTLTTPDGNKYFFGGLDADGTEVVERSKTDQSGAGCGRIFGLPVITSWYLRKIEAPNQTDAINFEYDTHFMRYATGISETHTEVNRIGGVATNCTNGVANNTCVTYLYVNGIHLKSIEAIGGKVEFITSSPRLDVVGGGVQLTEVKQYGANDPVNYIRRFVLNQDYWQSTTGGQPVTEKHRRLRLLSVQEIGANNNTSIPPYFFEYESTLLPPRLSKARDFWGYYNGQTGNTSLIPASLPENPNFYPGGGNRYPDLIFAKAGALKKVIYPAGGHTLLEYELHEKGYDTPVQEKITSTKSVQAEYDYPNTGGNTSTTNFMIDHNQDVTISYNVIHRCGAPAMGVSFLKIEEKVNGVWQPLSTTNANIRPSGTGNEGPGTIIFQGYLPTDEIINLSNSFTLNLSSGEYRLISSGLNNCLTQSGTANDNLSMSVQYQGYTGNLIYNELVGGLRVKKVTTHDGLDAAKDMVKTYQYNKATNLNWSSGYATRIVDFETEVQVEELLQNSDGVSGDLCVKLVNSKFSESQLPLNGTPGGHIAYEEVTVLEGTNDDKGKTWNKFSRYENTSANTGSDDLRVPLSLMDWRGGSLLNQIIYKKENGNFIKVQEQINEYSIASTAGNNTLYTFNGLTSAISKTYWQPLTLITWDGTNNNTIHYAAFDEFNYLYYPIFCGWQKLDRTISRQYDETGTNYMETVTDYDYDIVNMHRIRSTVTNSDGTKHISETTYPTDYHPTNGAGGTPLASGMALAIYHLKEQHQVNIPIEQTAYIEKQGQTKMLLGGAITEFERQANGLIVPKNVYASALSTPLLVSSFMPSSIDGSNQFVFDAAVYEKRGSYLGHDAYGTALGFQAELDIPNSYLYAYQDMLPVMGATNAHYTELAYTSFEGGDETGWTINGVKNYSTGKVGDNALNVDVNEDFPIFNVVDVDGQEKKYILSAWVKTPVSSGNSYLAMKAVDRANPGGPSLPVANTYVETVFGSTHGEWQLIEVEIDLEQVRLSAGIPSNQDLSIITYVWNPNGNSIELDAVRFHPSDAFVRTVDYNENTYQVLAMEGENRKHNSFYYDDFQRLYYSKDFEGNIVGINDYNVQWNGTNRGQVHIRTARIAGLLQLSDYTGLNVSQKSESFQYTDGLGRVIQTVAKQQSPTKKDIISFVDFDEYGRTPKSYLGYADPTQTSGAFNGNALANQQNFYANVIEVEGQTAYPYTEIQYEASPLNRPLEQANAGNGWQMTSGNTSKFNYQLNVANEVLYLDEATATAQYYPANTLTKSIVENAKGAKVITYTDKMGRSILTKVQQNATKWAATYTIYDDFGNVKAVVSPLAIEEMVNSGSYDYSATAYEELIYTYGYDERQRLITQKIPNKARVDFVYDPLNRQVATQDGILRAAGKWMMTKYDKYSRPVMTALQLDNRDRATLQAFVEHNYTIYHEVRQPGSTGYSNNVLPWTNYNEVQSVNYYDDYDFDRDGLMDADNNYLLENQYPQTFSSLIKTLPTGSKVRLLDGTNRMMRSVLFYDSRKRIIQSQVQNHRNGWDHTFNQFDFIGQLQKSKRKHTALMDNVPDGVNPLNEVVTEESYYYDHSGRLTSVYHQVGNEDPILLHQDNYDELGRMIEKNLHSSNDQNFWQSVDYRYDVHNWLVRINDLPNIYPRMNSTGSGAVAYLQEQVNEIILSYNQEDIDSGDVKTEMDVTDESTTLSGGSTVGTTQTTKSVDLYGETEGTITKDESIYIDFSDLIVDPNNISASLEYLRNKMDSILQANGVTDPMVLEMVLERLNDTYRDRWLLMRADPENENNEDLFAMNFAYDVVGNISHLEWRVRGNDYRSIYDFNYDLQNHLLQANYQEFIETSVLMPAYQRVGDFSVSGLNYDVNGNIKRLIRQGNTPTGTTANYTNGQIDDLIYNYNGNQLKAVIDASLNSTGFKDGVNQATEYQYDVNGNMTIDDNKGIIVEYNHLNRPTKVTFTATGHVLEWFYDAAGNKIKKKVTESGSAPSEKHYIAGIEYVDDELEAIYTSEGRIIRTLVGNDRDGNPIYDFRYEYGIQDHLGNSRVFFSDLNKDGIIQVGVNGAHNELIQQNHYYPYGMNMLGHWNFDPPQIGTTNDYQYNGIELNDEFGLNWNMAFYRSLDPAIGRWTGVDPVIQPHQSPYNAMDGNPVIFIDPMGDKIINPYEKYKDNQASIEKLKAERNNTDKKRDRRRITKEINNKEYQLGLYTKTRDLIDDFKKANFDEFNKLDNITFKGKEMDIIVRLSYDFKGPGGEYGRTEYTFGHIFNVTSTKGNIIKEPYSISNNQFDIILYEGGHNLNTIANEFGDVIFATEQPRTAHNEYAVEKLPYDERKAKAYSEDYAKAIEKGQPVPKSENYRNPVYDVE